ncbi:S-layer homology domain-containing protein [Colidextribacter sp. 210702-DFI.3.9]|nr:S-layer homology domain-containing protein [Colidextribacter sp. 210702-DFI.3.9]
MKKRVLSMFMALALCLTLLPTAAWAEETDAPEDGAIVQEEQQEKAPAAESPAILEQAAGNGIAAQNGGDSTVENAVAEVTSGGEVTYYENFNTALNAAKAGDTLKLLKNVQGGNWVTIDKAITFDLNGHEIYYELTVKCKIILKDSAGGTGKIALWLRVENGLNIGDLLEEGYALRNADTGAWYGATGQAVGNVTVQQVPITSVTLTALNADGTAASTSIPYGTTGGIKLSASCTRQGAGELSCQWYTIGGTLQLIDGAKGTEYNLPADLSVGKRSYRVTFTADGYSKSADITITVTKIDLANATVTINPWHADGKFRFYPYASETAALSSLSAVKVTANGKEDTLKETDYTYEGATATRVGKYTLTITATDSCANYTGSKTFDWEVIPYQLWRPEFQSSQMYTKTYDGTTTLPGSYTWLANFFGREGIDQGTTLKSGDYEVTAAEFVSADAGKNKPINQTITLKNDNFVFSPTEIVNVKGITTTDKTLTYTNFTPTEAYPTGGTTFKIEKATMPDFDKEVTLDIVNNHADTYTVDLSALLPKLESPRTYGEIEYSQPTVQLASGYYTVGNAKVENGKLILTIDKNPVTTTGPIGTVTVQVTTTNYKPVTLTVNLRSVNKRKLGMFVSVATDPIVYGMTLGDIKLSAEATVGKDNQVIPGTIAWDDPLTTVPAAGQATYRWTFTPDDTMHYLTASNTITFSVDKATPTGAPTYTAITTGGKTLADAPLTPNASWPSGTVQWVDKDGKPLPASTQVQANTEYTWSFTPADAANYNGATGSVTLYAVSSGGGGGGGGSSSASKTSTTTNADGSVTKTETKSDGTVVETTTGKDGSTTKTETKKDGSSVTENKAADGSTGTVKTDKNGNTEAETKVSAKAVEDAKKSGEAVKAPVEVEASRDSSTAPTVKVELPKGTGETKVEIPVSNVKPGTVAVLVHPDGTEEIVKDSLPTEDGIQLTVNGGATVKIVDNSKDFIDTRNHWAKDAIDFVSARGLVSGMSSTIYAPDASTTRAQLWTILARQNNADLTGGATWYEKAQAWSKASGVSDGSDPNAAISRAQVVTMLWRAAGSPAAGGSASFADVPADSYYAQAVAWAVEGGITAGVGGGRFDPNSTCTRAQIATFLWRAMAE